MSYVLLEDGARFDGDGVGAPAPVTGEVVFNTSMSGYQESMTDPSYERQLITFTYPHIGNYGVSAAAMESDRVHAAGGDHARRAQLRGLRAAEGGWLDWLRDCGIPAISGVDTRALVRHIRERGRCAAGSSRRARRRRDAAALIAAEPPMSGADLVRAVTRRAAGRARADRRRRGGPTIVLIDTGVKTSMVANLRDARRAPDHPAGDGQRRGRSAPAGRTG